MVPCDGHGTVIKPNSDAVTQQCLDDLKGFRGKAKVSTWQTARHIS